jgi:hypothetical protein
MFSYTRVKQYFRPNSLLRLFLASLLVLQPVGGLHLASAQGGAAAALAFKGILDQLQASVDTIINNARNAGLELELVLGEQIAAEISLARQEFKTELDQQEAQLSAKASQFLDNLRKTISQLTNHALAQAQDLINQAQLIALSLPFADDTPRIRAFTPVISFRPPQGVNDLVFSVGGVFPDFGKDPKYTPTLVLDTKDGSGHPLPPFPATSGTALSAVFHVPSAQLVFPNSALQSIQAHININYSHSCWLLFHCDDQVSIPELIGLLPQSPGNLHLAFSVTTEVYVTQLKTSYVMHQDAGGGDDLDHRQQVAPDSGFEVIPDAGGDWGLNGNCSTATAACWRIKTVQHHCVAFICPQGNDGSVNFQLTFYERKLTNQTQNGQFDPPINWNQTALYTFPTNGALTWTAIYTDFNNHAIPFGSSDTSVASPYLKATNISGTTYGFTVYPFNTDASSELSIAIPQGAYSATAPLNVTLFSDGRNNLNPLTPHGMSTLTAYAADGLAMSLPTPANANATARPDVHVQNNFTNALAVVVAPIGAHPAPAPSPAQSARLKALNALAGATSNPNIGFK